MKAYGGNGERVIEEVQFLEAHTLNSSVLLQVQSSSKSMFSKKFIIFFTLIQDPFK
jgi:hypothetical protein